MMMNFKKVAGAGIAAVTLSLMSTSAMASIAAGATVTYATQAIGTTGAISIPAASAPIVTLGTATSTGNFTVTYTLPAGVTFTATPTLGVTGGTITGAATYVSGGTGSNNVVYLVNVSALGVGATATTLTFTSALAITGATALATANTTTFTLGEQVTNTSVAGVANETTVSSAVLAKSGQGLTFTSTAGAAGLAISSASPNNGTKFQTTATPGGLALGDIGSITVGNAGFKGVDGVTQYAFTSTTDQVTLTGATTGLTGAYLTSVAGTCAATLAANTGGITGTVASGSITFAGIPYPSAGAREICLYSGTSLIAANPNGFNASAAIDSTTLALTGTNYNLSSYTFSGGTPVTLNYLVNAGSGYSDFIRIANTSPNAALVTAIVTSDAGVTGSAVVETALAAGNNDLVAVNTIAAAAGVTSANGRYVITLISAQTSGINYESLLVNPGGVVTQLQ